ncbi:endolysin [Gordonia phage Syleon]|uniref:Lysin A, protease C39 domain n=1 Tax=Gordonia phage Syleon TaxID=2653718 RepID=A0A5Q2WGF8_9CAUD|nr:endolysin [Gordonia phage Syleon]QGH75763.1 lysin A, protease C39 domain [Gordonia phage Syleon]
MRKKTLPYTASIIKQDTYYWCGPATVQNIASSRKFIGEPALAKEMGTTTNGTNHIGLLAKALNKHLGVLFATVLIGGADATVKQRDKLWADLKASVDGGYGVAMNWIAPPNGYPKGVLGSRNPSYGGGTVYHYVAAMGYAEENGKRYVLIVDSGFSPYSYWVTLEQCATLIAGKGYAYAVVPARDELEAKPVTDFVKAFLGPLASDVKDIRGQLVTAWKQLGGRTVVDGLADTRRLLGG